MKGSSQLLASPRRRRRLARVTVLLLVAGAVAFGVTRLTLNEGVHDKEVFQPGKPVVTGNQKTVPLRKADRREIGKTLVAFVRDGVAQRNPIAAYDLVTSNFRGGTTRAQWRTGSSPVYVYPAVTGGVGGNWRVDYSYRRDVGVALMLSSTRPGRSARSSSTPSSSRNEGIGGWTPSRPWPPSRRSASDGSTRPARPTTPAAHGPISVPTRARSAHSGSSSRSPSWG